MSSADKARHATRALEAVALPERAARIREALEGPTRIVLVGAVGAGKTTLFTRLTGVSAPTGLGGVTRRTHRYETTDHIWLDTPGLEGPRLLERHIRPAVEEADVVLWVVDGLRPGALAERELIASWCAERELRVLVSRADLLGDEAPAVLERMRALTAEHGPSALLLGDTRRVDAAALGAASRSMSGPRRRRLQAALQLAQQELGSRAAPTDPHDAVRALQEGWRAAVKRVHTLTERRDPMEILVHRVDEAARRERVQLQDQLSGLLGTDAELPGVTLPAPGSELERLLRGPEALRRELKRALADWHLEGRLALDEALGSGRSLTDRGPALRHAAADQALAEALAAISTRS